MVLKRGLIVSSSDSRACLCHETSWNRMVNVLKRGATNGSSYGREISTKIAYDPLPKCRTRKLRQKDLLSIMSQILIDMPQNRFLTHSIHQRYAFSMKTNMRVIKYFSYHLPELQLKSTTLNNLNDVISRMFWRKRPNKSPTKNAYYLPRDLFVFYARDQCSSCWNSIAKSVANRAKGVPNYLLICQNE